VSSDSLKRRLDKAGREIPVSAEDEESSEEKLERGLAMLEEMKARRTGSQQSFEDMSPEERAKRRALADEVWEGARERERGRGRR
jgi:hypothetical protein